MVENKGLTPFRIEEPFLKGHLALWLAARGAAEVRVSVDGAEPNPDTWPEASSSDSSDSAPPEPGREYRHH